MWIMLNDAFFSIVKKDCKGDELLVRARRKGDIERVFGIPPARVQWSDRGDYLYRARICYDDVCEAIENEVLGINYDNFKDSVACRLAAAS